MSPGSSEFWPQTTLDYERSRREKLSILVEEAKSKEYDMIICHHRAITREMLSCGLPLAILDYTDAPSLELSRYLIHLDQVVGVLKGVRYTDLEMHDEPTVEGMYHGRFMNHFGLPATKPEKKLKREHLEKIELIWGFGCFPSNRRLVDKDITAERLTRCSFVGSVFYDRSRLVTNHRKTAIQKLGQLPNCIAASSAPRNVYDEILLKSKICLSPYGYGSCYRSFEGIYAGCIILSPKCDFMESWPNIYIDGYGYVECKPDWSDLEKRICFIENNYEQFKIRSRELRQLLLEKYWNESNITNHVAEVIKRCLNRK